MFDLSLAELAFFAIVGLLVIDADDIPKIARTLRKWLDKFAELKHEIIGTMDDATKELNLKESLKAIEEEKKRAEEELQKIMKALPETTSSSEIVKLNKQTIEEKEKEESEEIKNG